MAPIKQWTLSLHKGTQTWKDVVHQLSSSTQELESTCPPSHILTQLKHNNRSQRRTKSSDQKSDTADDNLDSAREWYQQFTALQQRKRLALSQWFKVASANHSQMEE